MQNQAQAPQIESKNLSLIEDQMHHESLAAKKFETYATQFTDPQLKQFAQDLTQHHKTHFSNLYQYLQSHQ